MSDDIHVMMTDSEGRLIPRCLADCEKLWPSISWNEYRRMAAALGDATEQPEPEPKAKPYRSITDDWEAAW